MGTAGEFLPWWGSIGQTTSLGLSRSFQADWLQVPFLGAAETEVEAQFGDVGLSSFGACGLFLTVPPF